MAARPLELRRNRLPDRQFLDEEARLGAVDLGEGVSETVLTVGIKHLAVEMESLLEGADVIPLQLGGRPGWMLAHTAPPIIGIMMCWNPAIVGSVTTTGVVGVAPNPIMTVSSLSVGRTSSRNR